MSRTFKNERKKLCQLRGKGISSDSALYRHECTSDYNYNHQQQSTRIEFHFALPNHPFHLKPSRTSIIVSSLVSVLESLSRAHLLLLSSSFGRRKTSRRRSHRAQSSNHNAVCSHSIPAELKIHFVLCPIFSSDFLLLSLLRGSHHTSSYFVHKLLHHAQ